MADNKQMIDRRTWDQFREAKLLWWINRTLHLFGWAIVVVVDADGHVSDAYPARVRFRGFDQQSEEDGFSGLTSHLRENIERIAHEAQQ